MNKRDEIILKEFKNQLTERIHIIDFRLFGSRARGDNAKDSDFDVFIEVKEISKQIKKIIQDIAWEISFENEVVITPIIFSKKEIDLTYKISPFYKSILKDGIKV
jgi:uncharacterized protein